MRPLKIMLISLVLWGVGVLSLGCGSESAPAFEGQVVTVQRGNLVTNVTGVGNLALSHTADLAFDIPSAFSKTIPVTVQEVLVAAGDSVKEGQVLARLDASTWQDQVTTLERLVTQAERQVTAKKRDLLTAQINLNNAELTLENTEETSTDPLEIEIKELQVELAQGKLEDAQTAVEDAQTAVEDAQTALNEAKAANSEIKAPFDGFITDVNVSGGTVVYKGTVAVTVADPTKFEAEIMVSENDILKVILGEAASVQAQAMQGVSFLATVTHIAPTATIQSGVVNYQVKVELTSLQPVPAQRQAGTAATGNVTAGAPSGRSGQAFSSGNLTQEQINQMIQQRQQARAGQSGGQSSPTTSTSTGEVQLTQGMTVTVNIMTAQRNNVLLVPTKAIISRGSETIVQVLKDGVTEERSVQTGISNWQYVEITSGLSEGEQVVVPQTTTTTTTSQQGQGPPGGIRIPGIGGLGR